jgi:DNA polymerase
LEFPRNRFNEVPKPPIAIPISSIQACPEPIVQILQKSSENISDIRTLEDLYNKIKNFEGCPLKVTATNIVFGDGVKDAPVMVVGEAPGADEDRLGIPFVGHSGQLLDKMLKTIGLDRALNVYMTNMIPWRPPGNRNPTASEIQMCLPFIQKHIELIQPKMIVCVGGISVKSLLGLSDGIVKLRGKLHDYQGIPAMALYHPAYLLRSPSQKRSVWEDLLFLEDHLMKMGIIRAIKKP